MPGFSGFGNTSTEDYFGSGYRFTWKGMRVVGQAQLACVEAVNDVTRLGADEARTSHIWDNRTGQTEDAVFQEDAVLEDGGTWIWGHWGVRDRPRFFDYDRDHPEEAGQLEPVSTVDVALFLEFGTVKMAARPWLYPAWDSTKYLIGVAVALHMRELQGMLRDPATGRFTGAAGFASEATGKFVGLDEVL